MILLKYIDNFLQNHQVDFSKLEVRFLRVVYINEEISIHLDQKDIYIISKNKVVIKGGVK